jgi:hypothetical protein
MMHAILKKLRGGDRRSIGRSDEVAADVLGSPALFDELINGLFVSDPLIRMRAADAVEKITRANPDFLEPHKSALMRVAGETEQQELRWHLAQLLPRLTLKPEEQRTVVEILYSYLDDQSKIVVTFALQALADFAKEDRRMKPRLVRLLEEFIETGSPAIKSRSRKLLRIQKKE